ncbi:MAG: hypothetical protein DLM68_03585 [Hyphomicrobiales bacterium]|nr:MAG: hypothetical protein DLM68_03585 [Hyphomicrobiales bacterium]
MNQTTSASMAAERPAGSCGALDMCFDYHRAGVQCKATQATTQGDRVKKLLTYGEGADRLLRDLLLISAAQRFAIDGDGLGRPRSWDR